MAGLGMPYEVVDDKLSAGRGEEFSASAIRERRQQELLSADGDFFLPINQRADDPLETSGLDIKTVDTAIAADNKGYQMLQRMGWGGKGLGRNESGIAEPIKGGVEVGLRLGLGKAEEDRHYTAAENVVRKRLEVEVQADEDVERTQRREMAIAQQQRIQEDVSVAKRNLFCETCQKQYKSATEMETHLSSYDHHHKKRLVEMKAMNAERTRGEREKKERRRQEKEAARLQQQIQKAKQASRAAGGLPMEEDPPLPPSDPPPVPSFAPDLASDPPPPPPPLPPSFQAPAAQEPYDPFAAAEPQRGGPDISSMAAAGGWDAGGAGPLLPDAKKPAMAFSMGAPSKGPARPAAQDVAAPRAMGAFAMSIGLRKAPVKKPVAGFGMDSDEEE
ncbi:g11353 [Coccomyxa viridis]|uniref:G11353 protein n=1 Tax=Coccomyxa viridis TaxID=1274662 RepID=A0ABP1G817_9CHLO